MAEPVTPPRASALGSPRSGSLRRTLPIALMQVRSSPSLEDLDLEIASVLAAFPATRLIVFPELHLTNPGDGFAEGGPRFDELEPIDGDRSAKLSALARKHGVWLIPGSIAEVDGTAIYNTLPVYSPEGTRVAAYRKIFPWRPYETSRAGNQIVSFDIPEVGRIGLTICYDAWFPEIHRQLAWDGCDAIINVVLTPTIDREQELVLARANAIVNQLFIVSVNAATPSGVGQSLIVDPEGRVRSHAAGAEPCVITDVLRLHTVDEVRADGTAGLNRVWDQFEVADAGDPIELPIYGGRITPAAWKSEAISDRTGAHVRS